MIKETIKYTDLILKDGNYEEIEKETDIRFLFSISTVKLYEQLVGKNIFKELQKVTRQFSTYFQGKNFENIDSLSLNDKLELLPIITDDIICGFMFDVIPCLYAEIKEGQFIQNEITCENCKNALWFMDLINLEFFMKIFVEVSSFKKATKKK